MSDFAVVAMLIFFGPGLLIYVTYLVRTQRWRDSVPLLEAVIDRTAGIEPPPRNQTDHIFTLIQLGAMTFVGLIFSGLGLIILLEALGFTE